MALLPSALNCCNPCPSPTTTNIPGVQGDDGTAGTNGTDGVNAYTTLTAPFVMPDYDGFAGDEGNATVADTSWMAVGQKVFIGKASSAAKGTFEVIAIVDGTTVTLLNMSDGTDTYMENSIPGTVFPAASAVSPAGLQGPAGADGTSGAPDTAHYVTTQAETGLTSEFNLGGLTTGMLMHTVAAGVSTPATATDGVNYLSPTTGLEPVDIGSTVQAFDAFLTSIAALGTAADKMIYTTGVDTAAETAITAVGRLVVGQTTLAALKAYLGIGYVNTVTKIAGYTAALTDDVILCDATAGNMTIDLPSAASAVGKTYAIKKIDATANTVTIDGNVGELIDGAATQVISSQWTAIEIACDGSAWYII